MPMPRPCHAHAHAVPHTPRLLPVCSQLTQERHERDVTIQRLTEERTFLQQQYDTLRRESMSPGFRMPGEHEGLGLISSVLMGFVPAQGVHV